jgi:hypothetical protein
MVIRKQYLKNVESFIGLPSLSETPRTRILLGEPIGVKFPPRLAPTTSPHHMFFESPSDTHNLMIGVNVAVNGILSIRAEGKADNHITVMGRKLGHLPAIPSMLSEIISISPIPTIPLIIVNTPARKNTVDQSISFKASLGSLVKTIIIITPPVIATNVGLSPN